jgi:pyruvate/2-oxoacid:ferredoxin oxidoreductase beta subunit
METTTEAITTYLVERPSSAYCKGCGHSHLIHAIDEALVKLQLDPTDVDITTDIGCVGLADYLFKSVHTVHTTHGRSTAFAVGTILADRILANGKLKTLVLIGDGGAMIGLLHIVHGAQVNVDITVLLHNNFFFGMTGGQSSAFSPLGFVTTTTRQGNIVPPLDICQMIQSCGAGFVARKFATDHDLSDIISEAVAYPGFALVEVIELCTAYGPILNDLSGKRLKEIVADQGWGTGVLLRREERKDFSLVYREKFSRSVGHQVEDSLTVSFQHDLTSQLGLIISGSAGERVQSSAQLFCQAAVMSDLFTTQKNDNPVTQRDWLFSIRSGREPGTDSLYWNRRCRRRHHRFRRWTASHEGEKIF